MPILTACNWLPFLLFKKPQSRFLGRVLRDKLAQKVKRWDSMERADDAVEVGEAEGEWEERVARQVREEIAVAEERGMVGEREVGMRRWLEQEGSGYGESKERFFGAVVGEEGEKERRSMWAAEAARQKFELWGVVNGENERSLERGKRMLEIVGREKELWAKERQERRDVKRAKRGKGPGGRGGGDPRVVENATVKQEQDTVQYKPLFWGEATENKALPVQSRLHKEKNTMPPSESKAAPRRIDGRRSLERSKGAPKSVTKPETDEDLMQRKLKAMQLSQRNAEKAYRNAVPTF